MSLDPTDEKSALIRLGAVRQQAITWANIDLVLCRHTAPLDHNEIISVWGSGAYIFSCDQAALWMVQSVCPSVRASVRLSVCPSHLFHYVHIIASSWYFQELLPMTKVTPKPYIGFYVSIKSLLTLLSDVYVKGQRSKVKFTEVKTQLSRFRTITPVWIHVWQWNDAHSFMWHRRCALLFFKVIRQISGLHC